MDRSGKLLCTEKGLHFSKDSCSMGNAVFVGGHQLHHRFNLSPDPAAKELMH